ncbi:Minichromosome loss protein-like protein [Emericellopsis cladophorae]|uniref:Minichromosome loss protein-like protein n=1 Tax=Emericellopsis cladophorae TaxID=2686198 RepID=A0A9P9Y1G3_9HYPO|nr:Minichromosome loss protein-like protein [Emericellopsis cladophorae]KAI6781736.1 Minichromosome loss protein-like protein [Emericellopsis cladophorae]
MDPTAALRVQPRAGHTSGTTRCAYTADGSRLVTAGSNNLIRMYKTGSDGEPTNIDDCQENNVALAAASSTFVVAAEDGTVSLYSIADASFDKFVTRSTLPVKDVAMSPDGKYVAVAGDELSVKVVDTEDITQVRYLREHARATRGVSFDPAGRLLTLSGTDGIIYVYSLTSESPELIRKVDGVIAAIDGDSDVSTKAVWHPDGRAFAAVTATKDIQVVSKNDWEKQRVFANGHLSDITALAWSPNGALLASASKDGKLLVWETRTQSVVARYDYSNVVDLVWHPTRNIVSFTTTDGEVFIHTDFLNDQFASLLRLPKQPAPFIHDPLAETSASRRPAPVNGKRQEIPSRPRRESLGSLDSFLGGVDGEDDDFVVDDDGAGYTTAGLKRGHEGGENGEHARKRQHIEPIYHEAFQPGSTPWRGNRKYLCLNLIGFVWTIDQDSHHTVTVEFYDHDFQRDFHFTDTFLYDKACLNEHGTLFSCPPKGDKPATIFYRPHETWTQRSDWRTELPVGEAITAMSLSESFITVTTNASYVRVFTLFGMPYRVYRPKSSPMVTCASYRDYVLTMGNGPVGPDGSARLLYTIENVKRDEICQNEDTVALPEGATVKSVFFSDSGDPCIYDSTGTLLTLLHWRTPSRACWVPLLDTKLLSRLASGRKSENYYPVAVADNKFHCIILKGGDQYPYFPRPLLSEFDFSIPIASAPKPKEKKRRNPDDEDAEMEDSPSDEDGDEDDSASAELRKLEQAYMLKGVQAAQLRDLIDGTSSTHTQRSALSRLELEIDKTLLQLLAGECREGEERGMRALEMVQLMRDRTGRMFEAAGKVADRYGRTILGDKIRQVAERKAEGRDEDDF